MKKHSTKKLNNRNNKICCPIHKEKTPSLSLDAKRNKWRCFGCGCGGDAIDFIREVRGLNYVEACQYLGVDLNEDYKAIVEEEEKVREEGVPKSFKNQSNLNPKYNFDNLNNFKIINTYQPTKVQSNQIGIWLRCDTQMDIDADNLYIGGLNGSDDFELFIKKFAKFAFIFLI